MNERLYRIVTMTSTDCKDCRAVVATLCVAVISHSHVHPPLLTPYISHLFSSSTLFEHAYLYSFYFFFFIFLLLSLLFTISPSPSFFFFFLNNTAPPEIYPLPLHAAFPI